MKFVNHVADMAGGVLGRITGSKQQNELTAQNNALQQHNFENQTQIRVRDALAAGINPLAALGMSSGYQPMFSSGTTNDSYGLQQIGNIAGSAFKGIQNLFLRQEEESRDLDLEGKRLDNEYRRAQIDHLRNMNPGITGGAYTYGVKTDKNKGPRKTIPAEDLITEGKAPANLILNTPHGGMIVPSKDAADSLDVEFGVVNPLAFEWWFKNKMPNWWHVLGAPFRAQRRLKNAKKVLYNLLSK